VRGNARPRCVEFFEADPDSLHRSRHEDRVQ
jgi:hypothetical protein